MQVATAKSAVSVFGGTPFRSASEMPSLLAKLAQRRQELQTIRSQQAESVPLAALFALFPKLETLRLLGYKPSSTPLGTSWTTLRKAIPLKLTSLVLHDCHLSSCHLRLLLSTLPHLRRISLHACDITSSWTSALLQILLHAKPLKHIELSPTIDRSRGWSFLPPGVTELRQWNSFWAAF